jgi:hypothetical protein
MKCYFILRYRWFISKMILKWPINLFKDSDDCTKIKVIMWNKYLIATELEVY